MKSLFTHAVAFIAGLWVGSTYFRHAVITFVTVYLIPILASISEWLLGTGPAPEWSTLLHSAWAALAASLTAAAIRWLQKFVEQFNADTTPEEPAA